MRPSQQSVGRWSSWNCVPKTASNKQKVGHVSGVGSWQVQTRDWQNSKKHPTDSLTPPFHVSEPDWLNMMPYSLWKYGKKKQNPKTATLGLEDLGSALFFQGTKAWPTWVSYRSSVALQQLCFYLQTETSLPLAFFVQACFLTSPAKVIRSIWKRFAKSKTSDLRVLNTRSHQDWPSISFCGASFRPRIAVNISMLSTLKQCLNRSK